MKDNISNKNARIALKQIKFEMAADYGMSQDDVFDIIENAKSKGVMYKFFKELENKKNIETQSGYRHLE